MGEGKLEGKVERERRKGKGREERAGTRRKGMTPQCLSSAPRSDSLYAHTHTDTYTYSES